MRLQNNSNISRKKSFVDKIDKKVRENDIVSRESGVRNQESGVRSQDCDENRLCKRTETESLIIKSVRL